MRNFIAIMIPTAGYLLMTQVLKETNNKNSITLASFICGMVSAFISVAIIMLWV